MLTSLRGLLMQLQLSESPVADVAMLRQQLSDIVRHAQSGEAANLSPSSTQYSSSLTSPAAHSMLSSSKYHSTFTSALTSPYSIASSLPLTSPPASSAAPLSSPSPSSSSTIPFPSPLTATKPVTASAFDFESAASDSDTALTSPSASSPSSSTPASPSLLQNISKSPLKVLYVKVQQQYTVTRRQAKRMTQEEREKLVPVPVRIMGNLTPAAAGQKVDLYSSLYFVARDVCQLIHLRQGSVSKVIHDFLPAERSRIPILCQRSTGAGCTQVLTVLTMEGVRRLLGNSQSPLAPHVLKWMTEQVELVVKEGVRGGANSGPAAADGRALKQMLKGSGMMLGGEKRKERKRERASAAVGQHEQHADNDKRLESSGGTDKKVKTDDSPSAANRAIERTSSAFAEPAAAHNSSASTPRHKHPPAQQPQQPQQSAFSSAAPPSKLAILGASSLSASSQYQQLLLDAQQRDLAAQVHAMHERVRENEQLLMLQQQQQQQQQLLSSAFPSLLPLSSPLPSSLTTSVRSLAPPLDSPSSAPSSFSHALLQHQLMAAYQQQQQQQQQQRPAALPLGPFPSLPSPLSGGGSGNTGSAFTSPTSASSMSLSGNTGSLLSSASNHTAASAAHNAHTVTASFKPLPQTFTPLTLPLQAN